MANVPGYTISKITFGPGILYLGPLGSTPSVDIGAVKGDASFEVARTALEVKQGSPQTLIKQYFTEEKVTLTVTGIEWNLDGIAYALGAGVTTFVGPVQTLAFGGDQNVTERALRYVHRMADGSTIDIQLPRAQGNGELSIGMKETDLHEFPFTFKALEAATDFTGAATATNQKLFKIIRTAA